MSTQQLHQGLVEDGLYSGTVQQFQQKYSNKESQQELYNGVTEDGDFSGSFLDFQNKFFPTQAAVTTSTKTPTSTTSGFITEQQRRDAASEAVNTEFWDTYQNGSFNREDWNLNEDGILEKTLKDGTVTLMPAQDEVRKGSGLDNIHNELQDEKLRSGELITKLKPISNNEVESFRDDSFWSKNHGYSTNAGYMKIKREDIFKKNDKWYAREYYNHEDGTREEINQQEITDNPNYKGMGEIYNALVAEDLGILPPKVEDFKDGKTLTILNNTVNLDFEKAKKDHEKLINSKLIVDDILSKIDGDEKLKNDLIIEKQGLDKTKTKDAKRIKEIDIELNKISKEEETNEAILQEKRTEEAKINMPKVTDELLKKDDSESVKDFTDKYLQYGFTFSIDEWEGDYINIKAWNGQQKKIKVDSDHSNSEELDAWMRENAKWYPSKSEALIDMVGVSDVTLDDAEIEAVAKHSVTADIDQYIMEDTKQHGNMPNNWEWRKAPTGGGYWYNKANGYSGPHQPSMYEKAYPLSFSLDPNDKIIDDEPFDFQRDVVGGSATSKKFTVDELPEKMHTAAELVVEKNPELTKEEVLNSWNELINGEDKNNPAIKEHPLYAELAKLHLPHMIQKEVNMRTDLAIQELSDVIEGMGGSWFVKGEVQTGLALEYEKKFDEISSEAKTIVSQNEAIQESLLNIRGDGETYGLEFLAKWLSEREKTLEIDIKKIQGRDIKTQEDADLANAEIRAIISDFGLKVEEYKSLGNKFKATHSTALSLQRDADEVIEDETEFALMVDLMGRNYQIGPQLLHSLTNATINLAQGIMTAAEVGFYYTNPFGRIGDFLVELSGDNEVLKTVVDVAQIMTGVEDASVRFDDDATTSSYSQLMHEGIDTWQANYDSKIQRPPSMDSIESFSDFGEWAGVMFTGQVPQLALMVATGGQSAWIQGVLMASSSGGQKFMGMEEEKRLYESLIGTKYEGLYGQDFGIDQMFFSSAAVGIAEALSERVTFGQMKGVNAFLKAKPGARAGLLKHMKEKVFSKDFVSHLGRGGVDLFEEGGSEVLATISENIIDIMNGTKGYENIYDGVGESFVSGALISSVIKSPIIFHHMVAPFTSPDNKGVINRNNNRVDQLLNLLSIGRPGKDATEKDIAKWEKQEGEYVKEIAKLENENLKAIAFDVKRVSVMDGEQGNKDKRELLDIHKNDRDINTENNDNILALEKGDITAEEFATRQAELSGQLSNNANRKSEILGKYTPDIVDRRYEKDVEAARQRAEEFNALEGVQVRIKEGNSSNFFDWMMNVEGYDVVRNKETGDVDGITLDQKTIKGLTKENQKVLDNDKSSEVDKKEARENIKTLESIKPPIEGDATLGFLTLKDFENINRSKNNYGAQVPVFNDKGELTNQEIFINKATSLDAGKFYTASHELLHGILHQTLQRDPDLQEAFGSMVVTALSNSGVVMPQALKDLINSYSKQEGRGEEIMTLISEAHRSGELKLPKDGIKNFKNFFRNWSKKTTNRDISFDTDQDVINFIQDYSFSMKNNEENKAITRMWASKDGAGGKLIAEAQAEYKKRVKKNKRTKGEINFSKNVDQELNNNPDLLTEIDAFVKNEDGSSKYTDKDEWQTSTDFVEAWSMVTQSKKLDGLIQAGMVGEGVNTAQALGEFTRKVKDELGERLLKNFDPGKNDSLFGWLTGVSGGLGKSIIYRAKGDVMVEYSKTLKTSSIDKGMSTPGGDTFSSQIEGEVDPEVERFDSEDLTIGKSTVKKSDIDIVFLESVNADPTVVKSINNIVESSGVNLEGLTYNGTKRNLVRHDGSKPKSKRKPTGPLYKVLDIVSSQFGVDGGRIIKEQDLTGTQRILAREYISTHAKKLIDMLPEGENRSGDATGVANTVLGEFYDKGDRISMAQSGTGKGKLSQTKREEINVNEFTEFFNKPGTKSDGAIRALITQAATISANQAIRLNAISKQSNPMSTIALAGDGKSAIMFSKAKIINTPKLQEVNVTLVKMGGVDRILKQKFGIEAVAEFWSRIPNFTTYFGGFDLKGKALPIMIQNKEAVKKALEDTFRDFPPVMDNIDDMTNRVYNMIGGEKLKDKVKRKGGHQIISAQEQLESLLQTKNNSIETASASYFGSDQNFTDVQSDKSRIQLKRNLDVMSAQDRYNELVEEFGEELGTKKWIQAVKARKNHSASSGRISDRRFIPNPKNPLEIIDNPEYSALQDQSTKPEKLPRGLTSLLKAGSTVTKKAGVDALMELSDKFEDLDNHQADEIAGNLNMAIEAMEDGYAKKATLYLNKFNQESKNTLKKKPKKAKKTKPLRFGDQAWESVADFYGNIFSSVKDANGDPVVMIDLRGHTKFFVNGKDVTKDLNIESAQNSGKVLKEVKTKDEKSFLNRVRDVVQARVELVKYVEWHVNQFNEGNIDNVDLLFVARNLSSNMSTLLARSAMPKWMERGIEKTTGKKVYEHMQPRLSVVLNLFDTMLFGKGVEATEAGVNKHFENYDVAVISKKFDDLLKTLGLTSSLAPGQTMDMKSWFRYVNKLTQDAGYMIDLDPIFSEITGAEKVIALEAVAIVKPLLNEKRVVQFNFSKAVNKANATTESTPSRGMSAFDFDETLIDKGDNTIIATSPDGKETTITSGQWPIKGPKLAEDGYTFDFSDFVNVRGGVEGPLMQKFRNRIEKFGIENNYILTARPAEANIAIQGWLKTKGIDMPLSNITGLGNSTGAAKAQWMVEKFAEGYNDMYFVDDALPNVKAVADVINQLDIKGKSVQAKIQFSKSIDPEFNNVLNNNASAELDLNRIIEQTKGIRAETRYSDAQAKVQGTKKGKWSFFVPPSAEDFKGLVYRFVGKGRQGEAQMAFFKKALFDPFSRANSAIASAKQRLEGEFRTLLKEFPNVKKELNDVVYNNFTLGQMIRVYNWNKAGFEVPGLAQRDLDNIVKEIEAHAETLAFANSLSIITNQEAGYTQPGELWMVENIQSDINTINNTINRAEHLTEWKQNVGVMFGVWDNGRLVGPNMNKIEAIYGSRFREALEDIVWRMEYGTKRQTGSNRLVNSFNNWANQSVGAIMFLNMRSALLQTISSINYLNWSDNNPLKAGLALANIPQFTKDFSMIFNSDMLKQRRAGNQRGINEAELAEVVAGNKFSPKAIINWLLTKGFLPTQIADSFAIASGGGIFYRNRVNSLIKQGLSQADAEARAWQDFTETTEESQQSSRPDMISQQQASPLGRYILAFKNTPMQYARLMKKAWLDIANGRGDFKTNLGKIIYYGGVQNLIFSGLQAAMGAMLGDDDEEKEAKAYERVANSMVDSILGGLGFGGNAVMTIKNTLMEYVKQNKKGWNADHTYTILKFFGFSPTIGSKGRKLYSAIQTEKFNEDVIKEMSMLDIDNPRWSAIANLISAITNIPIDRLVKKMDNVDAALTEDISAAQRLALLMGWNTWDLGIDDSDVVAVEEEIKENKEIEVKEKRRVKKEEKKIEKEKLDEKIIEDNIEKQKTETGEIKCAAVNKLGKRCGVKIESGKSFCTIHEKVEQGAKEVQCKKIKSDKKRCGMKTSSKSGYCYYHD